MKTNRIAVGGQDGSRVRAWVHALIVGSLGAAAFAGAQEQDDAGAVLDEIVVTAQKREQRLQDVPIAVSVVGGDLAERAGGFAVDALRTLVPALNIRKTNTPINSGVFLRGVGTITFAIAAQPSVATVVDGVVLTGSGEAFGDLYDVERIEVLRGPQGTLFGKNSSAGVINIVTRRPGEQLGGYVDVQAYEDEEIRVKASLDMPFSEALRSRTTVTYGNFPGYIDNITTGPAQGDLNGYHRRGVRSVWQLESSDTLGWTLALDWRKSDDNCCVEVIGVGPTGAQAIALRQLQAGVNFAGDETRQVRQNFTMRSAEESYGASLQADADLGAVALTSITAWRKWDSNELREGDWLDATAPYIGINQIHDVGPQESDTFSQELRIASPGDQFVDYVAGLYYSRTDTQRSFRRNGVACAASTLAIDATGLRPCTPTASTLVSYFAQADYGADFENYAVFADGTFNLSDRFRLIAGLRYTNDDVGFFHDYTPAVIPVPIPGSAAGSAPGVNPGGNAATGFRTGFTGRDKSDNVSGRAGLQFDWTDDFMTYATYSRGYKGPAFNAFFNMVPTDRTVIEAEEADSYEVGAKATLFDGRAILNAAGFYSKYENFQTNNFLILNGVTITTLTNAGDVTTGGVELDLLANPTERLTLNFGFAYTDARVDQFFTPVGRPPSTINGTALPFAPKFKGTLGIDYRVPFAAFDLIPNVLVAYQDEQWTDLNENPLTRVPGYTTVDLSIAFADKNDRLRVALVARNLTDESFATLITTGGPGGAPRLQIPREADRHFGIQARYNFGVR